MKVYDLDGTLSTLNSTFDFVIGYHKTTNHWLRLFLCETTRRVMNRLPISSSVKRRVLICLYFLAVKEAVLNEYFKTQYKERFLQSLTDLGVKVKTEDNSTNVLLTGCTSIPAEQIGLLFGFGHSISTKLRVVHGRIFGMTLDTYGNEKITPISNHLDGRGVTTKEAVYYTDNIESESKLVQLFGTVHKV